MSLQKLFLGSLLDDDFFVFHLLHLFIGILLQERAATSPPLIYFVDYFYQSGLVGIYFILWVEIPILSLFILLLKLFSFWPLGTLLVVAFVVFYQDFR